MQILVISDVHSNLTALEAVLSDVGEIDAVWCLGDLVGYGPEPNECIARVQELPNLTCILGNHDAAVLKYIDIAGFNQEARQAILWTQNIISTEKLAFLDGLPEKVEHDQVTLAHGSPRQPVWEYLLDPATATRSFSYFDTPYCFVGHTHIPVIYGLSAGQKLAHLTYPEPNKSLKLKPRAIFNPGSVGQPRDRDPRAAYAVYDPDEHTLVFRRVPYDVSVVQERMKALALPERHIQRLGAGW